MVDSDSSLSSPPSTDDEMPVDMAPVNGVKGAAHKKKQGNLLSFFKQKDRSPTPPRKKREPSPEHIYVPEDNPDIAFIVMFRSRFNDAFPRGAPTVGPQDIELGVAEGPPSSDVEGLLCALLGLVLNRKKPVEKGHFGRALEESIQTQKSQWPRAWESVNPLSGSRGFHTMTAKERITLLHTLCLWSLNQNEQVKAMIADAYKSRTTKDRLDTNIPLSVQPWGHDGEKRRYWLVEGQNDTHFRVYRETDPHKRKKVDWFSVAGSIDELRVMAAKLEEEDGRKEAKALGERMLNAIPRFEASEVKRKRREYRVHRNAAFTRPDPGFSLYEGRTRGKRLRYTFSDEEDFDSDNVGTRRSARASGNESAVQSGPTVTASGRQVRSRATGLYGEILHSGQVSDHASPATGDYVRSDASEEPQQPHAHGRSTRAANGRTNGRLNRTIDSDDEEEDATSWDGGDEEDDEPDQMEIDDEDVQDDSASEEEADPQTLMVTLRYGKGSVKTSSSPAPAAEPEQTVVNGTSHPPTHSQGAPLAGPGAQRQPVNSAPEPALQAQPPSEPQVPNGVPAPVQLPSISAAIPVIQQSIPASHVPAPKADGILPLPMPSQGVPQPEAVAQQPQPVQASYPVAQAPALPLPVPQQPLQHQNPQIAAQPLQQQQEAPILPPPAPAPAPAPASTWQ